VRPWGEVINEMPIMVRQSDVRNRMLANLPSDEYEIIAPHLGYTELDRDYVLILPNISIEYVYFP
jgi:hypothetical protein